jgi:ABC-type phosphate transport system substrate-binding protein
MTAALRKPSRRALLLLGLLWHAAACAENEIAVIAAGDSVGLTITRPLLRDIYLKKVFLDDTGQPLIPVNLPPDNPLRLSLAATLFNKNVQQLQGYWNQRYFQGVAPPYMLGSQEAVIQFVAKTPGAIGYIASCRLDARVKRLLGISVAASQREAVRQLCRPPAPSKRAD